MNLEEWKKELVRLIEVMPLEELLVPLKKHAVIIIDTEGTETETNKEEGV